MKKMVIIKKEVMLLISQKTTTIDLLHFLIRFKLWNMIKSNHFKILLLYFMILLKLLNINKNKMRKAISSNLNLQNFIHILNNNKILIRIIWIMITSPLKVDIFIRMITIIIMEIMATHRSKLKNKNLLIIWF